MNGVSEELDIVDIYLDRHKKQLGYKLFGYVVLLATITVCCWFLYPIPMELKYLNNGTEVYLKIIVPYYMVMVP